MIGSRGALAFIAVAIQECSAYRFGSRLARPSTELGSKTVAFALL